MPLQTRIWTQGAHGPALPTNLTNSHFGPNPAQAIPNVIGLVTHKNMWGEVGPIADLQAVHGYRVDRQNAPGGFMNVSVQRNGVGSPSTVASVFVPDALAVDKPGVTATAAQSAGYAAKMRELERAVRRGLELSLASYGPPANPRTHAQRVITRYEVFGTFSNP